MSGRSATRARALFFLEYLKDQEKFDFRKDKLEWLPNSREMAGTAASGYVVGTNMQTEVANLFAAGDDVGGVPWMCSPGAFTMGWKAGEMRRSREKTDCFSFGGSGKAGIAQRFLLRRDRQKRGLYWREVEMAIQNIMDYTPAT